VKVVPQDLKDIGARPIAGYGIGEVSRAFQSENQFAFAVRSYYTTLAMESGIFALLVFLVFLLGSILALIRHARRCRHTKLRMIYISLSISLMSAAVGLLPVNMTEQFTYMFALLAVGHRVLRMGKSSATQRSILRTNAIDTAELPCSGTLA
jgi:hypothetical protein